MLRITREELAATAGHRGGRLPRRAGQGGGRITAPRGGDTPAGPRVREGFPGSSG